MLIFLKDECTLHLPYGLWNLWATDSEVGSTGQKTTQQKAPEKGGITQSTQDSAVETSLGLLHLDA